MTLRRFLELVAACFPSGNGYGLGEAGWREPGSASISAPPRVVQLSDGTGWSVHRLTPMRGRPRPRRALPYGAMIIDIGRQACDGDTPKPGLSVENDIELVKSFDAMRPPNFRKLFEMACPWPR